MCTSEGEKKSWLSVSLFAFVFLMFCLLWASIQYHAQQAYREYFMNIIQAYDGSTAEELLRLECCLRQVLQCLYWSLILQHKTCSMGIPAPDWLAMYNTVFRVHFNVAGVSCEIW